jgi:hypothetical protein
MFGKCSQIVAYVDNVIILGRRLQDVKKNIYNTDQTNKEKNKMGLEINKKKTTFDLSRKSYIENEHLTFGTCNLK